MESGLIVDARWIAENIKNVNDSSTPHIQDCGACIHCPNPYCSIRIDNTNVRSPPWPGLPKGVKFDPTDEEVIEHLEAKCGLKPQHPLIEGYISSVTNINYALPQDLPGAKMDGSSIFFFNQTEQAYIKGEKKKRKITTTDSSVSWQWHITGQTKPIIANGVQRGFKKILVLYEKKKGQKREITNWVLHEYHLRSEEKETGDFVVSKIFYQNQKRKKTTPPPIKMDLDPLLQGAEYISEDSYVAAELNVSQDYLVYKEFEASSSYVEMNPNYGSELFPHPDLENADLGSLFDFEAFASEEILMNEFGC